jgi:hypothetical protein
MSVNETRKQRDIAKVDNFRICGKVHSASRTNRGNPIVVDDNDCVVHCGCASSIDQTRSAQHYNAFAYWYFRTNKPGGSLW